MSMSQAEREEKGDLRGIRIGKEWESEFVFSLRLGVFA
jgi:hypothetical protein